MEKKTITKDFLINANMVWFGLFGFMAYQPL